MTNTIHPTLDQHTFVNRVYQTHETKITQIQGSNPGRFTVVFTSATERIAVSIETAGAWNEWEIFATTAQRVTSAQGDSVDGNTLAIIRYEGGDDNWIYSNMLLRLQSVDVTQGDPTFLYNHTANEVLMFQAV